MINEMELEAIKTKCRRLVGLSNYLPDNFETFAIEVEALFKWIIEIQKREGYEKRNRN